jgi:hypothetical protein
MEGGVFLSMKPFLDVAYPFDTIGLPIAQCTDGHAQQREPYHAEALPTFKEMTPWARSALPSTFLRSIDFCSDKYV